MITVIYIALENVVHNTKNVQVYLLRIKIFSAELVATNLCNNYYALGIEASFSSLQEYPNN